MAHEAKAALRKKIHDRRGEVLFSVLATPAIDALMAYFFSSIEKELNPAKLLALSEKDKKALLAQFAGICKKPNENLACAMVTDAIDIMNGKPPRKWAFGILPHQFMRYCAYAPVAFTTLWIGNGVVKPLYNMLSPSEDTTLQELEKINHRESYLHSVPLRMIMLMLCITLELTTDFKIPKMLFLMLLSNAVFAAKEGVYSTLSSSDHVFIENTSIQNNPSVFFKTNTKNQEMRNLMLTGKINVERKGNGFFVRDTAQKGYDLKARLADKRAYFTKEVDAQGEITYLQLENKPKRPGKIA